MGTDVGLSVSHMLGAHMSATTMALDYLTAVGHVGATALTGPAHRRVGRLATLGILTSVVPTVTAAGALGTVADEVFFRGWRDTPLDRPVFIVGNHRTGSTFLQRLLARDAEQFATTRFVDLFLHSVSQKRVLAELGRLDGWLGGHGAALVDRLDRRWAKDFRNVHSMGLGKPEEDDYLLLTRMASGILWETVPDAPRLRRHFWSDTEMDAREQDAHLHAYANLARRHKYHHGGRVWLSKNPLFSTRVRGLRRVFPKARFVYLVRHPEKVVASTASLLHEGLGGLGALRDARQLREMVHEICLYMYDETLANLEGLPPDQLVCVRQEDLLGDADGTVRGMLEQLDLDWSTPLAEGVAEAGARGPRKTHRYGLEDHGFTRREVAERYTHVMERWGYVSG